MTTKKKIRIYYRAPSHVPLWKVMEECGFLEKHGLEMDFGSLEGQRKRAAEGLKKGELDVVSGNHHNLYARRALNADPYVHIAQSNNSWRENYLVLGLGINGLQDLEGKRVAMDDYDGHTGLNVWLYLRQHGLEEGRNVELVTGAKRGVERAKEVMDGRYDATFIRPVDQLRAQQARRAHHGAADHGDDRRRDSDDNDNLRAQSRRRSTVFDHGPNRRNSLLQNQKSGDAGYPQETLHGAAENTERRRVGLFLRYPSCFPRG